MCGNPRLNKRYPSDIGVPTVPLPPCNHQLGAVGTAEHPGLQGLASNFLRNPDQPSPNSGVFFVGKARWVK
jgi:hypothetical protein